MDIEIFSNKPVALVRLNGRVSHDTTYRLAYAVADIISTGCIHIVLSLKHADMVISTGLRFFVEVKDQLSKHEGRLVICDLKKDIIFALATTDLTDYFELATDERAALHLFQLDVSNLSSGLPKEPLSTTPPKQEKKTSGAFLMEDLERAIQDIEPEAKPRPSKITMEQEELVTLIRHHLPSRLAVDILNWYVIHNHSIGDPQKIATALRQDIKNVKNEMKALSKRHCLKDIGGEMYNYSPERDLHLQLKKFFTLWHCPEEHARILSAILANEP